MKINNFSLIIELLISFLVLNSVLHIECRRRKIVINNRITAYPFASQAMTSVESIKLPKPGPPLLSKSLDELDPTVGITKDQFIAAIPFSLYQIDRSQLELIFLFANQDHDDILERNEWDQLNNFYVLPFEACLGYGHQNKSTNNDMTIMNNYTLTVDQFKICFEADPKSSYISFRELDRKRNPFQIIKNIISNELNSGINFYQYLFTRKAIFAWHRCHSSDLHLSKNGFNCAISHLIPNKHLTDYDKQDIYNTGLKFQFNDNALIQLDFISFLRIAHYANVYALYGKKNEFASLNKKDFLNSLIDGRETNGISEDEMDNLYLVTDSNPKTNSTEINFDTWCFFFHFHKLYDRYSKERPMQINKEEFLNLLNDEETPIKIVMAIDTSFSNFDESQYLEASIILQHLRPKENNFFYSFRSKHKRMKTNLKFNRETDNSKHNNHKPTMNNKKMNKGFYYDHISLKNESNREIFFSIFLGKDLQYLSRSDYFRAFQLSNLFIDLSEKVQYEFNHDKRPFYSSIKIKNVMDKIESASQNANPPISIPQRKAIEFLKFLPDNIDMDLLTFTSLFHFENKLIKLIGSNNDESITEIELKMILENFGMKNIPDTVIDIGKKGYDKLGRRLYDIRETIKNVFTVQAVASEQMRNAYDIMKYDLKKNHELSRLFPMPKRRSQLSHLV